MKFRLEKRGGLWILVDVVGCRVATDAEVYFWRRIKKLEKALKAAKADL